MAHQDYLSYRVLHLHLFPMTKKLLYDFDEGIKKYRSSNTRFLSYKEFKNNNLSVLTSNIINIKDLEKSKLQDLIKIAEAEANKSDINDQVKFLADQKIDTLRSIN